MHSAHAHRTSSNQCGQMTIVWNRWKREPKWILPAFKFDYLSNWITVVLKKINGMVLPGLFWGLRDRLKLVFFTSKGCLERHEAVHSASLFATLCNLNEQIQPSECKPGIRTPRLLLGWLCWAKHCRREDSRASSSFAASHPSALSSSLF